MMNRLALRHVRGYVSLVLEGENLLRFIEICRKEAIFLWELDYTAPYRMEVKVSGSQVKQLESLAKQMGIKILTKEPRGLSLWFSVWINKKHQLLAFLLSLMLLVFLSNTVWKIDIHGLPSHLERDILHHIKKQGVYVGAFQLKKPSIESLEKELMHHLPQLLYISVKKRGTIYTIEGIEKQVERDAPALQPGYLIARKSGVIQHMLIKEGKSVVQVNDLVNRGDLLVTGNLQVPDEERLEDTNLKEKQPLLVQADGSVYAQTWYEIDLNSHLSREFEEAHGELVQHYDLRIGPWQVPIKFWPKLKESELNRSEEIKTIHLFGSRLAIDFVQKNFYYKRKIHIKRTADEASQQGIATALTSLQQKLGKDTEIVKYYILDEAVDNGRVKLKLYVSVIENIAQFVPYQE